MTIGEVIKRMRKMRKMTQQDLGEAVGFPARNAAIRIAQYEMNYRVPKEDMTEKIAHVLDISPFAIAEPSTDAYYALFQVLFSLEDEYGAEPKTGSKQPSLVFGQALNSETNINNFLNRWHEQKQKLESGKMTKDEYDEWRYSFPKMEATNRKVPLKKKS